MTIQNWEQYKKNLWDWKCLDGCFGKSSIAVSDLDGVLERNGVFLAIETKAPNVPVKTGQRILFENLVRTQAFTVLFVWGKAGKPERIEVWLRSGEKRKYENADLDTFRDIVSQWFKWANKQERPK